jgi:hypothetical protein
MRTLNEPGLRSELARVVESVCAGRDPALPVQLDHVGDALGSLAVTPDEIGLVLDAIEARGFSVEAPQGGGLELHLRSVVLAAAALKGSLARRPTLAEVAAHAGLDERSVRHALALLRVMQR